MSSPTFQPALGAVFAAAAAASATFLPFLHHLKPVANHPPTGIIDAPERPEFTQSPSTAYQITLTASMGSKASPAMSTTTWPTSAAVGSWTSPLHGQGCGGGPGLGLGSGYERR